MKKIFSYIGITALALMSFMITSKTTEVIKETDEIMIKINEEKQKYEKEPIDAKIKENDIIPGQYGKKINIEKTYDQMKKLGKYNPEYYVYEEIKPKLSIEDIYDKYIEIANPKKNQISIILNLNKKIELEEIEKIIKKHDIKVTILIDNKPIVESNYFTQGNNYCYLEEENESKIKECAKQNKHTIKKHDIKNNLFKKIKQTITNGKIISIEVNEITIKELELTINYIKNKGYKIVKIKELLSEKNTN